MNKEKINLILNSKYLTWIKPYVSKVNPFCKKRESITRGLSIGVFYSILIPFGQIPFAIITSIFLKGNVLFASMATFVSNPVTYIPIYILAYSVGNYLIGKDSMDIEINYDIVDMGFSLVLGLLILSIFFSILTYLILKVYYFIKKIIRVLKIKKIKKIKELDF